MSPRFLPVIAKAARKLNNEQDGPAPEHFDAAGAMQSPPRGKLLDAIGELLLDRAPANTEFVAVTKRLLFMRNIRSLSEIGRR
jgi:hypothetical protein